MLIKRHGKKGDSIITATCPKCGRFRRDFLRFHRHQAGSLFMSECCCDTTADDRLDGGTDRDSCSECTHSPPLTSTDIEFFISGVDASVCERIICTQGHALSAPTCDLCVTGCSVDGTHGITWQGEHPVTGECWAEEYNIGTINYELQAKQTSDPCPDSPDGTINLYAILQMEIPESRWRVHLETTGSVALSKGWMFDAYRSIGIGTCFSDFTVPNEISCVCTDTALCRPGANDSIQLCDGGTINVNFSP